MSCAETRRRLDDYLDDALTPSERREVEAHLGGCLECRTELASVGALLDTVADLKGRKLEPGHDLWPSIHAHLADPRGRARRSWKGRLGLDTPRFVWQFAAAVVVLVVGVGLGVSRLARGPLFGPGGLGSDRAAAVADTSAAGLPRQLAVLDAEVSVTRGEVRAAVTADSSAAGPWKVFDQNLQLLDGAIRESRAALARDPDNPILQKSLLGAYQKQLELLRWASRLVHQG